MKQASLYILMLLTFLIGDAVAEDHISTSEAQAYWNLKLHNVPMPSFLKIMLPTNSARYNYTQAKERYNEYATMKLYSWYDYENESPAALHKNKYLRTMFIRQDNLRPGKVHQLMYQGAEYLGPAFMRRDEVSKNVPFSTKHLSQIFEAFSINPSSQETKMVVPTLKRCEDKQHHDRHFCAPSMEDMVDYVSHHFGPFVGAHNLKAEALTLLPGMDVERRYVIKSVEKAGLGKETISCHKAAFPYALFFCHHLDDATPYKVTLQSLNNQNLRVETLVGCHHDTSSWHPKFVAFENLGLKPGQPICHFLPADNVMFVKKATN